MTVMGLGLHGGAVGTVRWLHEQGAQVTVTDWKSEEELAFSVRALQGLNNVRFVLGRHEEKDFIETDMVVRNPAVRRDSPLLAAAHAAGVPVEMDSSLFWQACPSRDIIGVTGSKGKTTCSRAISTMLRRLGQHVVEVGTDGVSPLAELAQVTSGTTVVFELSSWRLEALAERHISPRTAVVTAFFPDHLNTYASLSTYEATKQTIIRWQRAEDVAVLNFDDEHVQLWRTMVHSTPWWFSLTAAPALGIGVTGGRLVVRDGKKRVVIAPASVLPLKHAHERRNVLPAILLAYLRGVSAGEIGKALLALKPLPHRLEEIGTVASVTYINDSASTVPQATVAALASHAGRTVVLIAGGQDKSLNYAELAAAINVAKVRILILLPGTATDKMRTALSNQVSAPPISDARDMPDAVQRAQSAARAGDVVLLSPGAASFGLFQHEFDRGDQFRAAVQELAVR